MSEKESMFLTTGQALEAVCIDFRRYDPQILLFCEVLRVVSGGDVVVRRETGKEGAWISASHSSHMRWYDGQELGEYLCDALIANSPDLKTTVSICTRVFQTRAFPAVDPETGRDGIRIETGMEGFSCRMCGECCRSLDYRDEVNAEDVALWKKWRRQDILERVGVFEREGRETTYRIWVNPGTTDPAEQCPFLHNVPGKKHWICQIHNVKPTICRNYPVSRKHGMMTGCPGFSMDNP